jgi:hypothetical protein
MTYTEFLAALERTPREWYLDVGNEIRAKIDGARCCPISAVTGGPRSDYANPVSAALYTLEMDPKTAWEIVNAADRKTSGNPRVRRDLLKACGLLSESGRKAKQ